MEQVIFILVAIVLFLIICSSVLFYLLWQTLNRRKVLITENFIDEIIGFIQKRDDIKIENENLYNKIKKLNEMIQELEEEYIVNNESRKLRILLVDQIELSRLNSKSLLENRGFIVDDVANSNEVLNRIDNNCVYDLIIVGNSFKKSLSGVEILRKLKLEKYINVPIVLLSTDIDNVDLLNVKFDYVIEKP